MNSFDVFSFLNFSLYCYFNYMINGQTRIWVFLFYKIVMLISELSIPQLDPSFMKIIKFICILIYQYKLMIHLPQLNSKGQTIDYWTHQSFLDKKRLQNHHKTIYSKTKFSVVTGLFASVLGSNWVYKTGKTPFAQLPWFGTAILMFLAGMAPGLMEIDFFKKRDYENILSETTLPLWKQKAYVVNIDRMFFFLDDAQDNEVNILHHGLTPERAQKIYPDLILGPIPNKPEKPASSPHH